METTLNIRGKILRKIEKAASSRGISRSDMICIMLKHVLDDASIMVRTGRLLQYQDRGAPEKWNTVHVRFDEVECEYFQDLRKLSKMSLSLILAYAVIRFLDKVRGENIADNNRYLSYFIVKEKLGMTISWRLIWGRPPTPYSHNTHGL
jgi:hypothetical protein